jgi:hypothetical protein
MCCRPMVLRHCTGPVGGPAAVQAPHLTFCIPLSLVVDPAQPTAHLAPPPRREDAELRKAAMAAVEQAERERAWRVARGEEQPGPRVALGPALREEWMTSLPPERSAPRGPAPQAHVMAFARNGIRSRGDTSAWTDTPAQRAARAAGLLPAAEGPGSGVAMLAAPPEGGAPAPAVAAAVAEFERQHRSKSLLEKHLERKQKTAKQANRDSKKKRKAEEGAEAGPDGMPGAAPQGKLIGREGMGGVRASVLLLVQLLWCGVEIWQVISGQTGQLVSCVFQAGPHSNSHRPCYGTHKSLSLPVLQPVRGRESTPGGRLTVRRTWESPRRP